MVGFVVAMALASAPGVEFVASDGWEQVVRGDVAVYARNRPGQRTAEVRGEKRMDVTPAELRDVLLDEDYGSHGDYIAEWRSLPSPVRDHWIRYTRLSLPIVDDRDYFIEISLDQDLAPDGTGVFRSSWKPWGLDRPERKGVVRVRMNEGYWEVRPTADGKQSDVSYYLMFDPGGSIPGWLIDRGNKQVLPSVMKNLEAEAIKRREAKKLSAQK